MYLQPVPPNHPATQMEVCRGHGEAGLSITGAEDDAEEKALRNSKCTYKCDKKLLLTVFVFREDGSGYRN